jgi:hypothetical protein
VIRQAAAALALTFVLAHLPFLPSSLDDIDSVNFALGVRDFDVAQHRPHPPGYPLYVAVAKAAVAAGRVFASGDDPHPASAIEARSMALVSLGGAVVAIFMLYRLFSCFSNVGILETARTGRPWQTLDARALAATALAVACPLFWYMAIRPMSDMPGLAAGLAADVCLALAWWRQRPGPNGDRRLVPAQMAASGRMIVLGSFLAAIAIGFRAQNAMLTVPLLLAVLIDRLGRGVAGAIVGGGVAFTAGCVLWGVPLLVASGGWTAYLSALGGQAGEDFAGVEMLYLNPSPRLALDALLRTLIYPWDSMVLGGIMLVLAAVGAGALLGRDRRTLVALAAFSLPYATFHLLFHDMDFVRYALPLVPAIAFLAVCGVEVIARRAAVPVVAVLALWGVAIATPVLYGYTSESSPVVRVLAAMELEKAHEPQIVLGMHHSFQRPLEAEIVPIQARLAALPQREWLELARYWREGNMAPIWFLADPRRTDLALVDSHSRANRRDFGWRFSSLSQIGGMRPAAVHWYRLSPPGWFVEQGWSLTPETAGIARAMRRGPHLGPVTGWIRRRSEAARVLIGGRHLGTATDPPVTFSAEIDGKQVAAWEARAGFFVQLFDLAPGTLGLGPGLLRLDVKSTSAAADSVATAIEQFDVQTAGSMMWAYADGWHEAEYHPRVGQWRWASERSTIRVIDPSSPIAIRLQIESPLRYFDDAPTVRLVAGDRVLTELRPRSDVVIGAVVPLDVLQRAHGLITLETDRTFVPAEEGGPPDLRHLGLRVFGVDVSIRN